MNEITLSQMLDAREQRAMAQKRLLGEYRQPLICFCLNIAGPVKNDAEIHRAFLCGHRAILESLRQAGLSCVHWEWKQAATGDEGFYTVDAEVLQIKRLMCQTEERHGLGRLFDLDVLDTDGRKLSRRELGLEPRSCLICSGEAAVCARSRAHSVSELQAKTRELLREYLWAQDARDIAALACRALLYEVCTTPKPGLVDRLNNGSHRDMDIFSFMSSTSALWPYFERCALTGMKTAGERAGCTLDALRYPGKQAETEMLRATGGVNTHKGAIFSVGLLCAACGRLPPEERCVPAAVCRQCARMTEGLSKRELGAVSEKTARSAGERAYIQYGAAGVREMAEGGFSPAASCGLPALESALSAGCSTDEAGAFALVKLMAAVTDINILNRGGAEAQKWVWEKAGELEKIQPPIPHEQLLELDREFTERNLSPGGSADLLAICFFLHFIQNGEDMR